VWKKKKKKEVMGDFLRASKKRGEDRGRAVWGAEVIGRFTLVVS